MKQKRYLERKSEGREEGEGKKLLNGKRESYIYKDEEKDERERRERKR